MALAIFLSYGLQFYVPINIVGPWFNGFFRSESQHLSDAGLRILLVVFTCKCFISVAQIKALDKMFFLLLSNSRTSRDNTKSGTNYLFGWCCEQQYIGVDFPTVDRNRYILAE